MEERCCKGCYSSKNPVYEMMGWGSIESQQRQAEPSPKKVELEKARIGIHAKEEAAGLVWLEVMSSKQKKTQQVSRDTQRYKREKKAKRGRRDCWLYVTYTSSSSCGKSEASQGSFALWWLAACSVFAKVNALQPDELP